jgi:hypothetical protein
MERSGTLVPSVALPGYGPMARSVAAALNCIRLQGSSVGTVPAALAHLLPTGDLREGTKPRPGLRCMNVAQNLAGL